MRSPSRPTPSSRGFRRSETSSVNWNGAFGRSKPLALHARNPRADVGGKHTPSYFTRSAPGAPRPLVYLTRPPRARRDAPFSQLHPPTPSRPRPALAYLTHPPRARRDAPFSQLSPARPEPATTGSCLSHPPAPG